MILYKVYYNEKFEFLYIYIFKFFVYILINSYKKKFENYTCKDILVGYKGDYIYKIFVRNKIIRSSNVYIVKKLFKFIIV